MRTSVAKTADSQNRTALSAHALSVAFKNEFVFRDLDFEVENCQGVVLMGSSGVGKTTLVRTLAGLLPPTTGNVKLDDEAILGPSNQICIVFQRGSCFPWLTAWENLLFPLRCLGRHRVEAELERARYVLNEVGLAHASDRLPREMSGGMVQRLALARAIVARPKILILDEPFSALDPVTSADMRDLLTHLQEQEGFSYLLVTHDVVDVIALVNRVVVMYGSPAKLATVKIEPGDTIESFTRTLKPFFEHNGENARTGENR